MSLPKILQREYQNLVFERSNWNREKAGYEARFEANCKRLEIGFFYYADGLAILRDNQYIITQLDRINSRLREIEEQLKKLN